MRSTTKIILTILLVILFALAFWHFNLKVLLADHYFRDAIKSRMKEDWPASLQNYEKVFKYRPKEPEYQRRFAMDLLWGLDFYKAEESKIKILNLAIERMNQIPQKEQVFEVKSYLGQILSKKASLTRDEIDFDLAEKAFSQIAEISPKMAGIYNDWCQLKIYEENWEEGLEMCRKAWGLYPALDHPQMAPAHRDQVISEMAQVYEKLGQIYFKLKNYQKAEEMYIQVLKFMPLGRPDIWKKIADIYYVQGDLDTAIQKNLHGYALNPEDPAWPLALGLLYEEKGDPGQAKIYGQKALELAPEDERISSFLESIDRK